MPIISPTPVSELESGHSTYEFALANGDSTEDINAEAYAWAVLIADVAMTIEIPNHDASNYSGIPAGQTFWINPTATLAGTMVDYLPPRFRLSNNSGGAGTVTVRLVPRTAVAGGAVPAPRF